MDTFSFHAPTRVDFGDGVRHRLPELLGEGRWGVLSSPSVLARSGIGPDLEESERRGARLTSLGHVSPNPRLSEVEAGLLAARSAGVDGVVAVGGGSVLDAGKLLRVALAYGAGGRETLEGFGDVVGRPRTGAVELLAIPTTAGTGAEVSRGAIITDDRTGVKKAARGEELIPDRALVDPELTASLPPRRLAETGFDVIAHAVETFLSRAATPITDILARAALSEAPAALLALMESDDPDARRTLARHSWLMGYNLAHASTCLPHRLQYPIGSATDTSHQIGLAALYPTWLRRIEVAAPERAEEVRAAVARALGPVDAPGSTGDAMAAFLERLGIRVGLRDLGLTEDDVPSLVDAVTGRTDLDPIEPDRATIAEIFRGSVDA